MCSLIDRNNLELIWIIAVSLIALCTSWGHACSNTIELSAGSSAQSFVSHASYDGSSTNYDSDTDDCYVLSAPSGYIVHAYTNEALVLDSAACNDEVVIFCGANTTDYSPADYCDGDTVNVYSGDNELLIRFETDGDTENLGFRMYYEYVSPDQHISDCPTDDGNDDNDESSGSSEPNNTKKKKGDGLLLAPVYIIVIVAGGIVLIGFLALPFLVIRAINKAKVNGQNGTGVVDDDGYGEYSGNYTTDYGGYEANTDTIGDYY